MSTLFTIFVDQQTDELDKLINRIHASTSAEIRIYSTVDLKYPHVKVSSEREVFQRDEKLMIYMKPRSDIDVMTLASLPLFSKFENVYVIPSNLFIREYWKGDVESTFTSSGYTFTDVIAQRSPSTHDMNEKLINHLISIFSSIPRFDEVCRMCDHLFCKAFQHESYSKVMNYEMLEAYGDRFLASSFIDMIYNKPGLWKPSILNDLIMHWQSKYILAEISEKYEFVQFIRSVQEIDLKIESDVIESLIGATYIAYKWVTGDGANPTIQLINILYQSYNIDPRVTYKNPATILNEMINSKGLDRTKVKYHTEEKDGYYYTYITYKKHNGSIETLGIGSENMFTSKGKRRKRDLVDKNSKTKAALNAIEHVKRST